MSNILSHRYDNLKANLQAIYGDAGLAWLTQLPAKVDALVRAWQLTAIEPVENMTFHFVAKAVTADGRPVIVKMGLDAKVTQSEMNTLRYFQGRGAVPLLAYLADENALLLAQAVPGKSLKDWYPADPAFVIKAYVSAASQLHQQMQPPAAGVLHARTWLQSLDRASHAQLPLTLLQPAIDLKNQLLATAPADIVLHGDLHHDNVLQHQAGWMIIDPKGILGEPAFEYAAFDLLHVSERDAPFAPAVMQQRIAQLSEQAGLDPVRLRDWFFVRLMLAAAWSVEDNMDPGSWLQLAQYLRSS